MRQKKGLVIVVGPTAVGKTQLSVKLASDFEGEIISTDSMQIYRMMDIGTAKISPNEMQDIPHWGINIVDPTEPFTVARYRELADQWLADIWGRGHLPFMVGGTGLYIRAVTEDFNFAETTSDSAFREELEETAKQEGSEYLHNLLQEKDPVTASRLHPNDIRRVIRALEIYKISGRPMSETVSDNNGETRFPTLKIGLTTRHRQVLYERINQRVDQMLEEGLVKEVKSLLAKGLNRNLISMQGIGYKEIIDYIEDRVTLQEAVETIKLGSRRYAKRQLSWFRRDPDIHWFEVDQLPWDQLYEASFRLVKEFTYRLSNTVEIKEDGGNAS